MENTTAKVGFSFLLGNDQNSRIFDVFAHKCNILAGALMDGPAESYALVIFRTQVLRYMIEPGDIGN
ncbi:hypothetical protein [Dyadobacter arcticus]|uniref:Uncharacterized protein n=1 Tax=Dyadobacter arcticus TaxID=1078754 RepID=A0ABX0UT48_9BACT|nr:hypothetical protein [Dyadobacter arcticus]NIJ56138.1 hypothetical protein [Dyadobacter arcticus]